MIHRARSAPASVPVPVPKNETEWLRLLEANAKRSEDSSGILDRQPTAVREPTSGKRKRRRDGAADPTSEARPANRWRQPAMHKELASRVASANSILNEAADMINANLRTLRSLKAANESLYAARVEAQAVAAKATADLREAWACNAVWYGRALMAEKQLNPSKVPAAAPVAATLDSVGSRCGYDRLVSMMGAVSAENSSLRTKLSDATAAKDQAEAQAKVAAQDKNIAMEQFEAVKDQIVKLTAKCEAAETDRESLESLQKATRKQLDAAQAQLQLVSSENVGLRAQVDASNARIAADAAENERLKDENRRLREQAYIGTGCNARSVVAAQLDLQLTAQAQQEARQKPRVVAAIREHVDQVPPSMHVLPAVQMQPLAQHDQWSRPEAEPQGYYREFRELQAVLPAGVNIGEDFLVRIPGVSQTIAVAFPPDGVAGTVHTFRLEGERQLQQWVEYIDKKQPARVPAATPGPTLKVEHVDIRSGF